MLVKCWQAALVAAILSLTVGSAGAQCPAATSACGDCCAKQKCAATDCCESDKCCKDGACCKTESCCKDGACCKKCGADCECCKDNKCKCGKGEECCCGKDKECCKKAGCCKNKVKSAGKAVCPFLAKLAKGPMIVVLAPSLPFFGGMHPELSGMMPPPPPMPAGPAVMLPHPLPPPPPMLTPPGLPVPTMTSPVMPPQTVALPAPPAGCYGYPTALPTCPAPTAGSNVDTCLSILEAVCDLCGSRSHTPSLPSMCAEVVGLLVDLCPAKPTPPSYVNHPPQYMPPSPPFPYPQAAPVPEPVTVLPPPRVDGPVVVSKEAAPVPCCVPCAVVPCTKATPSLPIRIVARPYSDQLEMSIDDDACMSCKKMTVSTQDSTLTLSRVNGRVRVRTEELKATADSVRTDRKDRLVLEGDVVLHHHKDGQRANVIRGDHIEVNLATGSVMVRGTGNFRQEEPAESGSRN